VTKQRILRLPARYGSHRFVVDVPDQIHGNKVLVPLESDSGKVHHEWLPLALLHDVETPEEPAPGPWQINGHVCVRAYGDTAIRHWWASGPRVPDDDHWHTWEGLVVRLGPDLDIQRLRPEVLGTHTLPWKGTDTHGDYYHIRVQEGGSCPLARSTPGIVVLMNLHLTPAMAREAAAKLCAAASEAEQCAPGSEPARVHAK
jgi:hypothetical protein